MSEKSRLDSYKLNKSIIQGQCDVDAVMVLLVQEMIYTCEPGEDSERQKKEVMVVSEIKDEADSNPGETKVTISPTSDVKGYI